MRAMLLAALAGAACADADREASHAEVRDSAGVTIVENDSTTAHLARWSSVDSPLVVIGEVEGAEPYLFGDVSGAVRLSDGTIVVAEGNSSELRFFDGAGEFLHSVGRSGEGPGEFRSLSGVWRAAADTLVAWDFGLGRATVIAPSGEFVRVVAFQHPEGLAVGRPHLAGLLGDGFFAMPGSIIMPGAHEGAWRDTVRAFVFDRAGQLVSSIGPFPGTEHYDAAGMVIPRPFGAGVHTASGDSLIWLGDNQRFELRGFDRTGTLRRIVRVDRPPLPLDDEAIAAYEAGWTDGAEGAQLASFERMLASISYPEHRPAFAGLEIDAAGNVWVREQGTASSARRWLVCDPSGVAIAVAELPEDMHVQHITDEHVLALRVDDTGVPQVALLPLRKGAADE